MSNVNPVKGTHDVIGFEADAYAYIEHVFSQVAYSFGYDRIVTPIFEHTEVFDRATGESSDVVRKEMYTFLDKGDRSLTLRPEGTAGVMRSIVTNKLYVTPDLPLKLFYSGTMYRYERPQLGRFREFRQIGVECVGEDNPYIDAETIALAMRILQSLGFQGLKVKVNTLGDKASREAYKKALREYFAPRIDDMCEDCHQRLVLNPMRILDCKVPQDQEMAKSAPRMGEFLSEESKQRFKKTLSLLDDLDIDYEIDDGLVRGLDYYGEVVFEIHCLSHLGKDYGAICGGGHYEGLLSTFGGPSDIDVGVGFAMGVERIYSLMLDFDLLYDVRRDADLILMPMGEDALREAFALSDALRSLGYTVEAPYRQGKLGPLFKRAERKRAKYAIIFGEEELKQHVYQVKDLKEETQETVSVTDLPSYLEGHLVDEGEDEGE
ncbi:MAG: histidine--tRNA ligase [Bacilli bacterium]|nr:histidine--tRNA ligase [Bacilli bacterium]